MNSKIFALALAAAAGSTAAFAAPQETLDYVAANGGSPLVGSFALNTAGNSVVTVPATGAYTVRSIRLQGNIGTILAASYGTETRIQVTTPSGAQVVFGPFLNHGSGSSAFAPVPFDRSQNIAATGAAGNWTVQTYETFNDTGDDALYDQLTVTLDDAAHKPASFTALGDLASSTSSVSQPVTLTAPGNIQWFQVTLPAVAAAGSGYVDMWVTPVNNPTTTTDLTTCDMAVYSDATNALVTVDTLDGPGSEPQVSYGSTVSRGTTTFGALAAGVARDGRDGSLAGGVYWVAVSHAAIIAPALGYNVSATTGATTQSTGILEIRTNPNTAPTPPSVSGGASSPANGPAGGSRLLTCVVAIGANPSAPISTVEADLTSVGGPAVASFNDSGLNGDATASDGIYSYALASATGTPGNVTVTATDALARTGSGTIAVNFFNAIALGDYSSGSHTTNVIADNVTGNGAIVWYSVSLPAVSGAGAGFVDIWTEPTADPIPVTDMTDTEIGLYDASGALIAGDDDSGAGLWSELTFGSTTSRGTPTFPGQTAGDAFDGFNGSLAGGVYYLAVGRFNVTYGLTGFGATSTYVGAQSQTRVHFNTLDNTAPTNPALSAAAASPTSGTSGTPVSITVAVTPGGNPPSSSLSVTADLSSMGGSAAAGMNDVGLNGDATAGDGIYTVVGTIPAGATDFSTYSVAINASDAELRNAIPVSVSVGGQATALDEATLSGGDAGDSLATAGAFSGSGALNAIIGSTDAATDVVDVYKIQICDFANFVASTALSTGNPDTQLFLFDSAGNGVETNDDAVGVGTSRIDSTFVTANGTYYLGVSRYNVDPVDGAAALIFPNTFTGVNPANGGVGALAGWVNTPFSSGAYRVSLAGTCLPAPAQCSPADVGIQGGGPGQDNLLNNNDFIAFIDLFFSSDPSADLGSQGGVQGADGQWNNNDFIVFIDYFFNDGPLCQG
ncbi:MAG: GC-type dockerin domain-anchored protein [Phycisphaerales bacterium]|nr:GC-type dockerin domain-anchored protein [Phycisphaerales bacterium]